MQNFTRNEWERYKTTLEARGKDAKLHSKRVEKTTSNSRFSSSPKSSIMSRPPSSKLSPASDMFIKYDSFMLVTSGVKHFFPLVSSVFFKKFYFTKKDHFSQIGNIFTASRFLFLSLISFNFILLISLPSLL